MVKACIIEDCSKKSKARGLCGKHYEQFRRTGSPLPRPKKVFIPVPCTVEDCSVNFHALGFCRHHYNIFKRHGDPSWVKKYTAEGYLHSHGYRILYRPNHPNADANGRLAEHRYLMSEALKRPLLPKEEVHHMDGNRANNNLSNLELWNTSQPPGQRVEDKIKWAFEILNLYGTDFKQPKDQLRLVS